MFTCICRYEALADSVNRLRMEMLSELRKMRKQMAHDAAALVAALNSATDEVANDLQALRDQVAQAVADKDEAVRAAVEGALEGFDAPIARLQALGADPEEPVPGEDTSGGTEVEDGSPVVE